MPRAAVATEARPPAEPACPVWNARPTGTERPGGGHWRGLPGTSSMRAAAEPRGLASAHGLPCRPGYCPECAAHPGRIPGACGSGGSGAAPAKLRGLAAHPVMCRRGRPGRSMPDAYRGEAGL